MKVERFIYALIAASPALVAPAGAWAQEAPDAAPAQAAPTQPAPEQQAPAEGDKKTKAEAGAPLDYDKYEKPTVPLPYVDVMGEGEANIILIPDPQFDERFWTPLMERNADKYRMHAVVLPGTSGTQSFPVYYYNTPQKLGEGPAVKNAENAIVDYIVTNGLKNVYVVGDGIGGKMAFDLIVDHPDLFKGGISSNGQPCHILSCLTIGVTHEARTDCAVNRILPGFVQRDGAVWAQRNAMSITSVIRDEDRGLQLSEVAAIQDKDVYATYYLESIVRDVSLELSTNTVPMYFLVGVSEKGLPPKRTLQWWRDRNFYSLLGAKAAKIVYFENAFSQKFLSENHPEAFDAAIAALVAGEEVKGIPSSGPDPDWEFNTDPGAKERARNGGNRGNTDDPNWTPGAAAAPSPERRADPRRDADPRRGQ